MFRPSSMTGCAPGFFYPGMEHTFHTLSKADPNMEMRRTP
jgi:hypothetical protein